MTFLAALADPTRLAILRQLAGVDEVCACDLTACCDVRQPTVSHHLRVLRDSCLVTSERRGTWVWYRLTPSVAERLRGLASELSGAGQVIPAAALRKQRPAGVTPTA